MKHLMTYEARNSIFPASTLDNVKFADWSEAAEKLKVLKMVRTAIEIFKPGEYARTQFGNLHIISTNELTMGATYGEIRCEYIVNGFDRVLVESKFDKKIKMPFEIEMKYEDRYSRKHRFDGPAYIKFQQSKNPSKHDKWTFRFYINGKRVDPEMFKQSPEIDYLKSVDTILKNHFENFRINIDTENKSLNVDTRQHAYTLEDMTELIEKVKALTLNNFTIMMAILPSSMGSMAISLILRLKPNVKLKTATTLNNIGIND